MKGKFQSIHEKKKKSLVKILISMCVYLVSHGLIASHLAIYKQASLKNNECVTRALMLAADEVTGSRWGEGAGWVKSAGLCYFPMKENARWGEDGTDTARGSSSSFDGRDLGCFSSAATVSAGKVNTHSQDCLRTSASSV